MHRPVSLCPFCSRLLAAAPFAFLWACSTPLSELPAYPLYPDRGRQLAAGEVAKLVGTSDAQMSAPIIKAVDGKSVVDTDLPAFALLPGCHVVQTNNDIMMANEYVAWRGTIGSATFALAMKAGYTYVIKLSLQQSMGGTAQAMFRALEQNRAGRTTAELDPVHSIAEINACLHPQDVAPTPSSP